MASARGACAPEPTERARSARAGTFPGAASTPQASAELEDLRAALAAETALLRLAEARADRLQRDNAWMRRRLGRASAARQPHEIVLRDDARALKRIAAFLDGEYGAVCRAWRQQLRVDGDVEFERRRWLRWCSKLRLADIHLTPTAPTLQKKLWSRTKARQALDRLDGSNHVKPATRRRTNTEEESDDDDLSDGGDEWRDLFDAAASGLVSAEDDSAIMLDLQRTHDRPLRAAERAALHRVLRALCARDRAVGYCQGMSFVAAFALRRASGDGVAAFGVLARLFDALDLGSMYAPDMPCLQLRFYQLDALLQAHLPALQSRLRRLGIMPEMYSTVRRLPRVPPKDTASVVASILGSKLVS
mmetsp:Transcript_6463/g.22700  ORF Transcript_6463/g.22700 Transcript_6463/m.22700 type:complete len:361 (+) Transcript_6463:39-1121(+)